MNPLLSQAVLWLGSCVALVAGFSVEVEADRVRYRLLVDNTWSEATHPGAFPDEAHFSFLGGGTHQNNTAFWEVGQAASPGTVRMAEFGGTDLLVEEVELAVLAGDADQAFEWRYWFCPAGTAHANCGPLVVEFEVDADFPALSLATMLGPSPDWFVSVSGLVLHDGSQWVDEMVVDLRPFDGGTRDANVFALGGPQTLPPASITEISAASGQIITPASLGTMHFQLLPEPGVWGAIAAVAVLAVLARRGRSRAATRALGNLVS